MAMQKLPPLTQGMSGPGIVMADHIDKENPFENTWGILKALKAEVRELQTAVVAEQKLRQNEVSDLKREMRDLKEELKKEKTERMEECRRIVDPIQNMTESLKESLRKVQAQREQQITELNEKLQDEKMEREADVRDLRQKLTEQVNAHNNVTRDLTKDLQATKENLEVSGGQARQGITNLTQDVKSIVDQMIRVNSTWQGFNSEQITSHRRFPGVGGQQSPRGTPTTIAGMTGISLSSSPGSLFGTQNSAPALPS
jgi:chromosome segregation ATPase